MFIEEVFSNDNEDDDDDDDGDESKGKHKTTKKIKVINIITTRSKNFTSFEKKKNLLRFSLRFIDLFRFMASSLSSLANNLLKQSLKRVQRYYSGKNVELASRKVVFCYDYIIDLSKYDEKLPQKEMFHNKMTNEATTDEDYEYMQKVFIYFKCKNLGEYSDHYLRTDVLLLADIFENFREICHTIYKLDPS